MEQAQRRQGVVGYHDGETLAEYERVVENCSDLIAAVGRDYRYVLANQALLTHYGLPRDQVIGRPMPEVVGQEVFERQLKPLIDRALQGEQAEGEIERFFPGRVRHVLNVACFPRRGRDGSVHGVILLKRNVTAQVQLRLEREHTLHLLQLLNTEADLDALLRSIVASLRRVSDCEAVGIRLRQGEDYPYIEASGFPEQFIESERYLCARDLAGQVLRDELGNPVLECMCGNVIRGRFDPGKPFFTAYGSFWTNNITGLLAGGSEGDLQARTRDRCNGEGYLSVALIPLKAGGETLGLLQFNDRRAGMFSASSIAGLEHLAGSIATGLARRQAEQALRRSEEHFRLLYEEAPLGYQSLDEEGRLLEVNQAWLDTLGYERQEVIGRPFADFLAPGEAERFAEAFPAFKQRGSIQVQFQMRRKDGRKITIAFDGRIARDAEGNFRRTHCILHDITERQRLEEQVRQLQKMDSIGRLAGGIAHDFNNLLTAIMGAATFALGNLPRDHPARDDVLEVLRAAERAADLSGQLLTLSRRRLITLKVTNLNDLVRNTSKMLQRILGENINLVTMTASDLGLTRADEGQIEQALVNLAINARDAMPDGGTLTIETGNAELDEAYCTRHPELKPGQYVMLAVSDTGIGMDDEVKAHLFEPFFTTKASGRGTGLGLATVYGIVRQHGGGVWVYSEPSRGSTFKIYLPRAREAEVPQPPPAPKPMPRGNETVLVVEDEGLVRRVAVRVLSSLGYKVLEAGDGESAVELAREHPGPIHLLMTDVMMPEMNGRQLAERLTAMLPGLKVLYASGYTDNTIHYQGVLAEGVNLLQKPFTAAALAHAVRNLLDQPT